MVNSSEAVLPVLVDGELDQPSSGILKFELR